MGALVSSPRAGGGFRQGGRKGPARRRTGMQIGLMVAALGVLAGCAAASPPPAAVPVAEESFGLSINSWGKPLFDWSVSASGDAIYTYARSATPAKFFDYDLVTKRFRV